MTASIDWIKLLENIGVLEIIPLPAQQNTTAQSDQLNGSLSDTYIQDNYESHQLPCKICGEKIQTFLMIINAIISFLSKCSKVDKKNHPSADLLNTYVPELMHNAGIMQELLESLIRNCRL